MRSKRSRRSEVLPQPGQPPSGADEHEPQPEPSEPRSNSPSQQHTPDEHGSSSPSPDQDQEPSSYGDVLEIVDDQELVRVAYEVTKAKEVWNLAAGERVVVHCNDLGQPIKKGGGILAGWLATVAKMGNFCPLNYTSWRRVPEPYKVALMNLARSKFQLPSNRSLDRWVYHTTSHSWRGYKCKLKAEYMVSGRAEQEVASLVPPQVLPTQWAELVKYWFSEKFEKYSQAGKRARASQTTPHTTGSKSFARRRYEFLEKHQREPGRVEFFAITHKKKDGNYVNEETQQLVETAMALVEERAAAYEATDTARLEHEVYSELLGDDTRGRVSGYGIGVSRKEVFGPDADGKINWPKEEIDKLREEVRKEMQEEMRSQIQAMQENYESKLNALQSQLEQVTTILQKLTGAHENLATGRDHPSNSQGPSCSSRQRRQSPSH